MLSCHTEPSKGRATTGASAARPRCTELGVETKRLQGVNSRTADRKGKTVQVQESVPKLQGEASLLGLISAVEVLLRDEQTDRTRHLRTLATGRAQGSFPTTCVLCGNQFSSQVGSSSTHLQTPRVHQQASLVESGEQQWHHQAERARPGRSQLEGPTGTPGEVLSWASVREAEISKVS